jgi:tRNA(Ile)-lysidine synthase TilS/MesJ
VVKPGSEFYHDTANKDGLNSWCKTCNNAANERAREAREQALATNTHTCTRCHNPQPLNRFVKDQRTPTGLSNWCKRCRRETRNATKKGAAAR